MLQPDFDPNAVLAGHQGTDLRSAATLPWPPDARCVGPEIGARRADISDRDSYAGFTSTTLRNETHQHQKAQFRPILIHI